MGKKDKPLVIVPFDDFWLNEQNREEHAEYMKKAVADDIKAWEEAGMDFLLGLGVERDTGRAYECFQKGGAAAEAWEHIGGCYVHDVGCEKNLARALECYRKAADMGNEDAKAVLREIENR